jgi:hypothetical protein
MVLVVALDGDVIETMDVVVSMGSRDRNHSIGRHSWTKLFLLLVPLQDVGDYFGSNIDDTDVSKLVTDDLAMPLP